MEVSKLFAQMLNVNLGFGFIPNSLPQEQKVTERFENSCRAIGLPEPSHKEQKDSGKLLKSVITSDRSALMMRVNQDLEKAIAEVTEALRIEESREKELKIELRMAQGEALALKGFGTCNEELPLAAREAKEKNDELELEIEAREETLAAVEEAAMDNEERLAQMKIEIQSLQLQMKQVTSAIDDWKKDAIGARGKAREAEISKIKMERRLQDALKQVEAKRGMRKRSKLKRVAKAFIRTLAFLRNSS